MKTHRLILLCVLSLPFVSYSANLKSDSTELTRILQLCANIRKEYAPDKRTALFQVKPDSTGHYTLETTEPKAAEKFAEVIKTEDFCSRIAIDVLPSKSLGKNVYALVNLSVANIRSNPEHAAELATQSLLGTPLDILKKEGYYYLVRTPDGYIAWLDAGGLVLKTAEEMKAWKQAGKLVFTDDYGHGFSEPNRKSERVSDLVMGDILEDAGKSKGFYKVRYPDGRMAYIPKEQLMAYDEFTKSRASRPERVIQIAKTMLGVPYLWGGTSVKGVDCSGFTKTAYFMNGVIIPRDASQQVLVGEPVDILENNELNLEEALKNLQPGDLLFFAGGKNKTPNARVTHVALYLGNGEFIQAAGKVRINSMKPDAPNYDDFQTRTVVAARRYTGHPGKDGLTPVALHPAYRSR